MDTKAMAKSKRAHSQHHSKKSHPLRNKPKDSEKPQQVNQTKSPPVQSRRVSALPSNSDRYDDDEPDLGLTNQPPDVIVPKSKGADYLHLLSEAQAESHSKIEKDSDCLDDLLHDEFSRVVGSMISARGEGMLSWMEDDNFIVEEDGSASNHEPGFLSLDLNALERMLEKVEVHERLYIQADLLPPELCTTRLNEPVQQESSGKIDPVVVRQGESSSAMKDIQILADEPEKSSAVEADLDFLLDSLSEEPNPVASASSSQNPSVQRSSAFETELDSLLDSHGGGAASLHRPANPSDQKLNTTGFGDMLDDLLESTSVAKKPQEKQTPLASTVGKSKVIEEFDSWLDTI